MKKYSTEDLSKVCTTCNKSLGKHRFSDNNCPSEQEGKGSIFGGNYELTKFTEKEPDKNE